MAATWMTVDQLWSQMVGYRVDASVLVSATENDRAEGRLNVLLLVASLSGFLTLACAVLAGARPALRDPQRERRLARRRRDARPCRWSA